MLSEGDFGVGLLLSSSNAKPINPATSAQPGPTGFGYWAAADNVGAFLANGKAFCKLG